jgi:hypothetical protein
MQLAAGSAPDPWYYVKNFQTMLDTLRQRDGDLLAADELSFMDGFLRLPPQARALLVRMVMRKGPLFRASRLVYPEIGATAEAVAPLVALGWVDARPTLTLDELFRLMTKRALVDHLGLAHQKAALPKARLLEELRETLPGARAFDQWCDATDTVYRLELGALCTRLTLLFFGNFRQDLTEFILADLGIFKFETIDLRPESRPFRTRRQVEEFHQLHHCRDLLHEGADPGEILRALPPVNEDCEWLQDRREKLRFQIGRALERAGAVQEATEIYSNCAYREAGVRARRLLAKPGGGSRRGGQDAPSAPEFRLVLADPRDGRSVERLVLEALTAAEPGETQVHYVENGLINSLFGLLCWPAIFAPVPGAFFHPFHHAPADIASTRFYERREREFSRCLAELRCGAYKDTMRRRLAEKLGISSPFVAWGLVDETLLETALQCFPAEHLARWFDWIARDVTANRSGFPDLVQFWPHSARYRLVEVKGPGDRLQESQRRFLDFCLREAMPVSVCRVRWAGMGASA